MLHTSACTRFCCNGEPTLNRAAQMRTMATAQGFGLCACISGPTCHRSPAIHGLSAPPRNQQCCKNSASMPPLFATPCIAPWLVGPPCASASSAQLNSIAPTSQRLFKCVSASTSLVAASAHTQNACGIWSRGQQMRGFPFVWSRPSLDLVA